MGGEQELEGVALARLVGVVFVESKGIVVR